jgi:hypothetical protein
VTTRRAPGTDRGLVLPFVLIVTVVLALVVVAVARYTTTNLTYGQVTEERNDRLAAADAAMRYAVDQIKVGAAPCLYDSVTVDLPVVADDFNGATGTVECATLSGGLESIQGWAAVLTGQGVPSTEFLVSTQGGSIPKVLNGPVWMSRVTPDSFDLANNAGIRIDDGPLVHDGGPDPCVNVGKFGSPGPGPKLPDDVDFEPNLVFGPVCSSTPWYAQPAFAEPPIPIDLELLVKRDGLVAESGMPMWGSLGVLGSYRDLTSGSDDCRVYRPGRYLRPPDVASVNAYFMSGDYYFDFRDPTVVAPPSLAHADLPSATAADSTVLIRQSLVTAGRLDTSIIPAAELANPECDFVAAADPGFGATFYFGGSAHIRISNQGAMEIMPRQQGPDDYVALHALCDWTTNANQESSWCLSSGGAIIAGANASQLRAPATAASPNLVFTEPGNDREMVVNGLIYAPLAQMEFGNVTNSAVQRFRGGLVLARAELQASSSAENFEIGVGGSPLDALIRLESTGAKNGLETRISAIVQYDPTVTILDDRIAVNSWRVCDASGC